MSGALIGEAPPIRGLVALSPDLGGSAGARLLSYSFLSEVDYRSLLRRNLFSSPTSKWSEVSARRRASAAKAWLRANGATRIVLLGARVRRAFGVTAQCNLVAHEYERLDLGGDCVAEVTSIPHPSGRCRLYNSVAWQAVAADVVRWALDGRADTV